MTNGKKNKSAKETPVSNQVFHESIAKVLETLKDTAEQTKKHLESKIEYFRRDAKEHALQIQKSLNARIDKVDVKVGRVNEELKITQQALRSTKDELNIKIDGVRTELKEDMKAMEERLFTKIDTNNDRLENHKPALPS